MAKITFHGESTLDNNEGKVYGEMIPVSKIAEIYETERRKKVALIFEKPEDAEMFNEKKVGALFTARQNGEASLMFVTVRVNPEDMVVVNADAGRKIEEPFSESRQVMASDDRRLAEKWAMFVESR